MEAKGTGFRPAPYLANSSTMASSSRGRGRERSSSERSLGFVSARTVWEAQGAERGMAISPSFQFSGQGPESNQESKIWNSGKSAAGRFSVSEALRTEAAELARSSLVPQENPHSYKNAPTPSPNPRHIPSNCSSNLLAFSSIPPTLPINPRAPQRFLHNASSTSTAITSRPFHSNGLSHPVVPPYNPPNIRTANSLLSDSVNAPASSSNRLSASVVQENRPEVLVVSSRTPSPQGREVIEIPESPSENLRDPSPRNFPEHSQNPWNSRNLQNTHSSQNLSTTLNSRNPQNSQNSQNFLNFLNFQNSRLITPSPLARNSPRNSPEAARGGVSSQGSKKEAEGRDVDISEILEIVCETCVICMDTIGTPFPSKHETLTVTPCGHVFHQGCIEKWVACKSSCPCCKRRIHVEEFIAPKWSPIAVLKAMVGPLGETEDSENVFEKESFTKYLNNMKRDLEGVLRVEIDKKIQSCERKLTIRKRKYERRKEKAHTLRKEVLGLSHSNSNLQKRVSALWLKVKKLPIIKSAWEKAAERGIEKFEFLDTLVPQLDSRHNEEELMKRLKWMAKEYHLQSSRLEKMKQEYKARENHTRIEISKKKGEVKCLELKIEKARELDKSLDAQLAACLAELKENERRCSGCDAKIPKTSQTCSYCPPEVKAKQLSSLLLSTAKRFAAAKRKEERTPAVTKRGVTQLRDAQQRESSSADVDSNDRENTSSSEGEEVEWDAQMKVRIPLVALHNSNVGLRPYKPSSNTQEGVPSMKDRIRRRFAQFEKMDQNRPTPHPTPKVPATTGKIFPKPATTGSTSIFPTSTSERGGIFPEDRVFGTRGTLKSKEPKSKPLRLTGVGLNKSRPKGSKLSSRIFSKTSKPSPFSRTSKSSTSSSRTCRFQPNSKKSSSLLDSWLKGK